MKFFILLLFFTNAHAMSFPSEKITRIRFIKAKNSYEIVIQNKAAFYWAKEELSSCLESGLNENVNLEIDPIKLQIIKCEVEKH